MRTLSIRVKHQNASALRIAQFLESHPSVAKVNYPGLDNHPQHKRAQRLFDGYAGMMRFEVHGGEDAAESFMHAATLSKIAPSLGGVETLGTRPPVTSQ